MRFKWDLYIPESQILYPSFLVMGIQLTPLAFPSFFQVTA